MVNPVLELNSLFSQNQHRKHKRTRFGFWPMHSFVSLGIERRFELSYWTLTVITYQLWPLHKLTMTPSRTHYVIWPARSVSKSYKHYHIDLLKCKTNTSMTSCHRESFLLADVNSICQMFGSYVQMLMTVMLEQIHLSCYKHYLN